MLDVKNTVIKIIYKNKIIINYYIKQVLNTYLKNQKSKLKLDGDLNFSLSE